MSGWNDGYYSEIAYTVEFQRQIMPVWLNAASLLAGYRPKDLTQPFRWCDLGCGYGFSALVAAACHPEAEIYGFDFNPAHIETARRMATEAGLSNARFEDTSFEALANAPPGTWPKMDFIVLHGVWSWISAAQRAHVLRFIDAHLAPGGIVYNSYNALAGWAAMLPVQKWLRHVCVTRPGPANQMVATGIGLLDEMKAKGALFFKENPVANARLDHMRTQDVHYVSHELLHDSWEPFSPDHVALDMAQVRCGFMGSATLLENFDAFSVPQEMLPMLAQAHDAIEKEMLRDFGAGRTFRRDLFRRGTERPPHGEWLAALDEIRLTDLGQPDDGTMRIKVWGNQGITLPAEIYSPVRQGLRAGTLSLGELRGLFPNSDLLREMLAVFMSTGIAHPAPFPNPGPVRHQRAQALNHAIARFNQNGGHFGFMAAPCLATALAIAPADMAVVSAFIAHPPPPGQSPAEAAAQGLAASGQILLQDGEPVTDPDQAMAGWRQMTEQFGVGALPVLRGVGIVPA